jgi:hypothetical protein
MFSIYIKEGNDSAPQSSILFGGYDEEAFLDPADVTEFKIDSNYRVPMSEVKFGDKTKALVDGQHAIFDPAYPYIYVPNSGGGTRGDFVYKVGSMINDLLAPGWWTPDICSDSK